MKIAIIRATALTMLMMNIFGCGAAAAKCPFLLLSIKGRIVSEEPEGLSVGFEITPDPNAVQESSKIEGGQFAVILRFDSTRTGGRIHHDCSRRPTAVVIRLLRAGKEVGSVELDCTQDFTQNERGDYDLRSAVELVDRGR